MRKSLLPVAFLLIMVKLCISYGSLLTVSTATTPSITNYYQNFAQCSCNLMPNLCDNYCCCDSICTQTQVNTWTNTYLCLNVNTPIQSLCNVTASQSFGSFEDLGCVYYTNRGTIGYYFAQTQASAISQPTPSLFAAQISTISTDFQNINGAISSQITTTKYQSGNLYLKKQTGTSNSYLYVLRAGLGGICNAGTINITDSQTYTCSQPITAKNCNNINAALTGTFSLCLKGDCSATSASTSIPSSNLLGSICQNVITSIVVNIAHSSLTSTNNQYILASATIIPTVNDVNVGKSVTVSTIVSVSKPTSVNGNPGYLIGRNIVMTKDTVNNFKISNIGDILTGNCYTNGAQTGTIDINFGQQATYGCVIIGSNPCSPALYVDSISQLSTLNILKYASKSSDKIKIQGLGTDTCNFQTITLNILYSYSGWQLDPQYYVSGAYLTKKRSVEASVTKKYLKIKWIYADPSKIVTPPSNTFYQYFSYLWTPLKQKFGMN